jgi:hypothetical protein
MQDPAAELDQQCHRNGPALQKIEMGTKLSESRRMPLEIGKRILQVLRKRDIAAPVERCHKGASAPAPYL